jgi:hypothetical protein
MADNVTRGSKISDCNIGEISKYSPYKYIIYIYIYPMEIMLLVISSIFKHLPFASTVTV